MMKKLVVLMLVVGMASLASAALTFSGGTTMDADGTLQLKINSDAAGNWAMQLAVDDATMIPGLIVLDLAAAGDLGAVGLATDTTAMTGHPVQGSVTYALTVGGVTTPPVAGDQFSIDIDGTLAGLSAGDSFVVSVRDTAAGWASVASTTITVTGDGTVQAVYTEVSNTDPVINYICSFIHNNQLQPA